MDWSSILENLASEAIGIAVTVFIIDRLIQRREERRWKPAKGAMHASIFLALNGVLQIFPDELLDKNDSTIYRFGNSSILPTLHLKWPLPYKPLGFSRRWANVLNRIDPTQIFELKSRIDEILNTSSLVLEPEPAELLYELDQHISILNKNLSRNVDSGEPERKSASILSLIVYSVGRVNEWLKNHADQRFKGPPYNLMPDKPSFRRWITDTLWPAH